MSDKEISTVFTAYIVDNEGNEHAIHRKSFPISFYYADLSKPHSIMLAEIAEKVTFTFTGTIRGAGEVGE